MHNAQETSVCGYKRTKCIDMFGTIRIRIRLQNDVKLGHWLCQWKLVVNAAKSAYETRTF